MAVCVCPCMHCVCERESASTCVLCAYDSQRLTSGVFWDYSPHYILRRNLAFEPRAHSPGCCSQLVPETLHLCLRSTGVAGGLPHPPGVYLSDVGSTSTCPSCTVSVLSAESLPRFCNLFVFFCPQGLMLRFTTDLGLRRDNESHVRMVLKPVKTLETSEVEWNAFCVMK